MKYFKQAALFFSLLVSAPVFAGQAVNVNTAGAEELAAALDGVGLSRAQAIVEYRDQNGPFNAAEQLTEVKGIGPATIERNRDFIVISVQTTAVGKEMK